VEVDREFILSSTLAMHAAYKPRRLAALCTPAVLLPCRAPGTTPETHLFAHNSLRISAKASEKVGCLLSYQAVCRAAFGALHLVMY
jgi:hypothetical protein